MNEIRELKLKKIMKRLNFLVYKDNNNLTITKEDIEEFNRLEKELKLIGFEHLGNGLIADLEEEQ